MRNFNSELSFSHQNEAFWQRHYKMRFPDLLRLEPIDNPTMQSRSVDRACILSSGRRVLVEEKNERYRPINFTLETWSNVAMRKPGWINKVGLCNFLAVGFVNHDKTLWLSWQWLQRTWSKHRSKWLSEAKANLGTRRFPRLVYNRTATESGSYQTEALILPVTHLPTASLQEVRWTDEPPSIASN